MGLNERMTAYMQHYNITHSTCTALKISVLSLFTPPHRLPMATTDLYTVSVALPFPKGHVPGIILYVYLQTGFFTQ